MRIFQHSVEPPNTTLHKTTPTHAIQVQVLEGQPETSSGRRSESFVVDIKIADTWYGNELRALKIYFRDSRSGIEHALETHVGGTTWSGEPLHGVVSPWADLALARRWVRECIQTHSDCASISSAETPMDTPLQRLHGTTKFIDTRLRRLVQLDEIFTPAPLEYLALSYVWGKEYQLITTSSTLEAFKRRLPIDPDSPKRLPRTIEDAISVAQSLGYRFLWVDALCIIQDSPQDLDLQLAQMDLVYSLANATIVARGSMSSDSGLPGVSSPRSPRFGVHNEVTVNGWLSIGHWDILSSIHEECEEKHGSYADKKFYIWRGWTFQEQILSTRCLEFSAQRMIFRCGRKVSRQESGEAQAATTDMRNPHHFRHAVRQYQRTQANTELRSSDDVMTLDRLVSRWFTIREYYSMRACSFMADRKRAIMGSARALNGIIGGIDSGGHFRNNIHVELLWSLDTTSHSNPPALVKFTRDPAPNGLYPSWSWLSLWPVGWPGLGEPLPGVNVRIRGNADFTSDSILEIEGPVIELRLVDTLDGEQRLAYLDGNLANITLRLDSSMAAGTALSCVPLARAISLMWWEHELLLLRYVGPHYVRVGVGAVPEDNSDVFTRHLGLEASRRLIECY
jgi:hypothetical protein